MDTLTHALSTMLAARASHPVQVKNGQLSLQARTWSGFVVGIFPDIDFVVWFFGLTPYLNYHRGITHSIILMPLWALLLAWLFSWVGRRKYAWRAFYPVCLLSLFVHIFGDVITAYGTMVFAPFSDYKLAFPTTFILDGYFSGIILLGLVASFISKRYKPRVALAGFSVLMCYVLAQTWWMHLAKEEAYATMPLKDVETAAVYVLPQPVSPFNWKLIIATPDRYYVRYINLFRKEHKINHEGDNIFKRADALYLPRNEVDWEVITRFGIGSLEDLAQRIWNDAGMRDIRNFMLFPAVQRTESYPGYDCVWFSDQRFVLRDLRSPFEFGGCESRDGKQRQILHMANGQRVPLK